MILVTGTSGFVGKALTEALLKAEYQVRGVGRSQADTCKHPGFQFTTIEDVTTMFDWTDKLQGVKTVIHTIARVHIMDDNAADPLAAFRKVNVEATLNLANQAAELGIKRFVFISSIKVNGESTTDGKPFSELTTTIPTDPYGLSKYEAEQGLLEIAKNTSMKVVIIRPPLIYGPGVKANFAAMMRWLYKGIPLPLGAVKNKRSLLALTNLVDFIIYCIEHPKAANEIFLISDGEPVSTTDLCRKIATAMGKKVILIPIPIVIISVIASLAGKQTMIDRLFGSLEVDCSKANNILGWKPVITMEEQLKQMVNQV
tara:strand:- start:69 stop:1010 length:942 start_codon:yes stop_codon:yes gene_type:complete